LSCQQQQDSSYGSNNQSSGLGRDNGSSDYNRGSGLGRDDITDRSNTLGRDEFSGGNTSGTGLGRDEYSSSNTGRDTYGSSNTDRDTYGSSNTGRDNFSSSNDNYGSSNTGSTGLGSSRNDDNFGHHHKSAGELVGDDELKPRHGIERDTHHATGGNYAVSTLHEGILLESPLSIALEHPSWHEHSYIAWSILSHPSIMTLLSSQHKHHINIRNDHVEEIDCMNFLITLGDLLLLRSISS
jgi:hypothetical protein